MSNAPQTATASEPLLLDLMTAAQILGLAPSSVRLIISRESLPVIGGQEGKVHPSASDREVCREAAMTRKNKDGLMPNLAALYFTLKNCRWRREKRARRVQHAAGLQFQNPSPKASSLGKRRPQTRQKGGFE